ncbi:MAG: GNAT family N-acetyltransferase [Ktedonobacteraceae bacterium]|nr:GNAT family N-acetyltransferase [Ktedonobacteraceae bacterium]
MENAIFGTLFAFSYSLLRQFRKDRYGIDRTSIASSTCRGCVGVQLPSLVDDDCEVLLTGFQPFWRLYAADVVGARLFVWRPDVPLDEREKLRQRADEALDFSLPLDLSTGINREVALAFTALPALDVEAARRLARLLTVQDDPLVRHFEPNASSDSFDPAKRPFVGIIDSDRLVCLAHCSRRTAEACELGIDTLPTARRKGYALAATVVWTQLILQEGRVPLYSAFAENTASLHLAAKAGYQTFAYGATFEIEQHHFSNK